MRLTAFLLAILVLLPICACEDSFWPERHWVAPEDISGRWVSEVYDPPRTRADDKTIIQEYFILQQDGENVSGEFIEVRRDGSAVSGPLEGTYDSGMGVLNLSYDSITYGYSITDLYRFTFDSLMYRVSEADLDVGPEPPFHKE